MKCLRKFEKKQNLKRRLKSLLLIRICSGADVSPELFFPDYTHAQKTRFCREEFVLALTDEAGKRKNAYCHKFLPPEYEKGW